MASPSSEIAPVTEIAAPAAPTTKQTRAQQVCKSKLLASVAENMGRKEKEVKEIIDTFLNLVVEKVAEGTKVALDDFGSFAPQDRKSRLGNNPKTGEKIQIAAKRVPTFTASKAFKLAVAVKAPAADDAPAAAAPADEDSNESVEDEEDDDAVAAAAVNAASTVAAEAARQ